MSIFLASLTYQTAWYVSMLTTAVQHFHMLQPWNHVCHLYEAIFSPCARDAM